MGLQAALSVLFPYVVGGELQGFGLSFFHVLWKTGQADNVELNVQSLRNQRVDLDLVLVEKLNAIVGWVEIRKCQAVNGTFVRGATPPSPEPLCLTVDRSSVKSQACGDSDPNQN